MTKKIIHGPDNDRIYAAFNINLINSIFFYRVTDVYEIFKI